jgi:hypothetical protein
MAEIKAYEGTSKTRRPFVRVRNNWNLYHLWPNQGRAACFKDGSNLQYEVVSVTFGHQLN